MDKSKTKQQLLLEFEDLAQSALEEAEETLRAIRSGEVDALVVPSSRRPALHFGGGRPVLSDSLETMEEGAGHFGC